MNGEGDVIVNRNIHFRPIYSGISMHLPRASKAPASESPNPPAREPASMSPAPPSRDPASMSPTPPVREPASMTPTPPARESA